ncbi:MAG: acetoin utilization protein AcuC [Armatimonadetes bacterium]|nr:acetoin utilization protein AcuC [Armatimonadota bacterium]
MSQTALVYTPRFNDYDLGPSHPLKPARVQRTYDLIRACGFLEKTDVSVVEPSIASEDALALVHSTEYIEAVRAPAEGRRLRDPLRFGLGTADNPIVEGMYEATAIVVGASMKAADVVFEESAPVAFNPGGGLHHAHHARAAGFCIFNDVAVAIAHLLERGGDGVKIAYVDIDAHHGDGVQEAFYTRRDVLTISVHESGRYLFPGTGRAEDIGEGEGEGFSVNLPLSPFTNDEVYVWAFQEGIVPLLEAFAPDFVVTQLGVDTHYQDPLTHMCLTTRGYMQVVDEIARRASRWIAVGGGGYDLTVVPRAWTLAFAHMAGHDPPEHIPDSLAKRYARTDDAVPIHDGEGPVIDEDWARVARELAEESVAELKTRVFPLHGLTPADF